MKNKFKIFMIVVLAAFTLNACFDEYLEPVPSTAISDLTAFDTKDRIVAQVNAMYTSVKSGQYLGGRYIVYSDIRGDDFLNLRSNGVTGYQTWQHNMAPSTNEVINLWGACYAAINRINVFLEGLENAKQDPVRSSLLTEAEFNQFRGEALALRGMIYFDMSQLYAKPYNQDPSALGMILRLKAERTAADNDLARSTVGETYTQILADLNAAEPLLPLAHGAGTGNTVLNVTRMQRNTVIALKSRVYLHMNNYQAALAEGNKIVPAGAPFVNGNGGVAYALNPVFEGIFEAPYISPESIFSIPMLGTELPGTQNQLGYYFSGGSGGNQEYPLNPSGPAWSNYTAFPESDARRQIVSVVAVAGVNYTFLEKYPAFPHVDYVPVMRYAEVLLNVAEAEARVNGVNSRAVALLNAVHQRSNPDKAYTVADFASANAFVDRVMLERNMEFLAEGKRSYDVNRKVAAYGAKGPVPTIPPTSPAYIWPISEAEMNTNQLVVQN
jgi:hypothetical protein